MRAILAVKNTFDAMVVDNSHKYLRKLRYGIMLVLNHFMH